MKTALVRFHSAVRSPRLTSRQGLALATAFGICFVTGLFSHFIQQPTSWFYWPSRPVQLYRFTQGLHVATGLATIPLLSVKLWSVYPKLFRWPRFAAADLIERGSLALLVAAALFQVVTGVFNISLWYAPMPFFFPAAHYWTAWLAVGSILVHVGVKLPIIRRSLRRTKPRPEPATGGISRRGVLIATGLAAGTITAATVGQTIPNLNTPLAPRRPNVGPQGVPVNATAIGLGVVEAAQDPNWRLTVGDRQYSLAGLQALPQHTFRLPITCVEGWSAEGDWTGVRLIDLIDGDRILVRSLQQRGIYHSSIVEGPHARDPLTLLALRLNGEVLHLDHGYPCRLIAPNRPGVMQTKWLSSLELLP